MNKWHEYSLLVVALMFGAVAYDEADKNMHLVRDNAQLESVVNEFFDSSKREIGRSVLPGFVIFC